MVNPVVVEKADTRISKAIKQLYEEADINLADATSGIIPVYQLIDAAYPLRVVEIEDLTYKLAAEFLSAETGHPISLPRNDDKSLSGFLFAKLIYGCILVNNNDPVARRRFSVAHELGHYVLHFLPLIDEANIAVEPEKMVVYEGLVKSESDEDDKTLTGELTFTRTSGRQFTANDIAQMEEEANQFAAELLMPAPFCEKLVKQFIPRFGKERSVLARRLATEFLVSKSAMIRRLEDLDLP
jgi:Zn-dependent peptidase ImmA (M78 family)